MKPALVTNETIHKGFHTYTHVYFEIYVEIIRRFKFTVLVVSEQPHTEANYYLAYDLEEVLMSV